MKALAIAALLLAATPALADAPYARCLHQGDITQYRPVKGGSALIVTDAFRKNYRINFRFACTGLDFHTALQIRTFAGNLSCIQPGDQVLLHDPASPPRCFIALDRTLYSPPWRRPTRQRNPSRWRPAPESGTEPVSPRHAAKPRLHGGGAVAAPALRRRRGKLARGISG